jgi:hypothetical protein
VPSPSTKKSMILLKKACKWCCFPHSNLPRQMVQNHWNHNPSLVIDSIFNDLIEIIAHWLHFVCTVLPGRYRVPRTSSSNHSGTIWQIKHKSDPLCDPFSYLLGQWWYHPSSARTWCFLTLQKQLDLVPGREGSLFKECIDMSWWSGRIYYQRAWWSHMTYPIPRRDKTRPRYEHHHKTIYLDKFFAYAIYIYAICNNVTEYGRQFWTESAGMIVAGRSLYSITIETI